MQTSVGGNQTRIKVNEILRSVAVSSTTPTGVSLVEQMLNPTLFAGTRIAQEAKLWQQFRFTKLGFRAIPSVPTIVSGQYLHGFDLLIDEEQPIGQQLIAYVSNSAGSALAPAYAESVAHAPVGAGIRSQNWYKTDANYETEWEDSIQGMYRILLTQQFGSFTGGELGITIKIEGEIEFCGRKVQPGTWSAPGEIALSPDTRFLIGSNTPGKSPGMYYYQSGGNCLSSMRTGFAYYPTVPFAFPAFSDPSFNLTRPEAVRLGPGDGEARFYKSLAGALAGDTGDLAVNNSLNDNISFQFDVGFFPGSLVPVPGASPVPTTLTSATMFRAPTGSDQSGSRGPQLVSHRRGLGRHRQGNVYLVQRPAELVEAGVEDAPSAPAASVGAAQQPAVAPAASPSPGQSGQPAVPAALPSSGQSGQPVTVGSDVIYDTHA